MKVLSRELHSLLRKDLGARLESAGFKLLPGASFACARAASDGYVTAWAQCDKYGWDDVWGCRFVIELQHADNQTPAAANIQQRARLSHLLEPEELEELSLLNNRIICGLPGTLQNMTLSVVDSDGTEVTVVGYKPSTGPIPAGADVWLHYFTQDHVASWAVVLSRLIPLCAVRLAGGTGS